jgi:hypothetical protein
MIRPFSLIASFVFALALMTQVTAQTKDDPKTPAKDEAPKPPTGWKEHSPRDGTYSVFVPEKPSKQSERERTSTISGQKLRINMLAIEMAGGPSYVAEEVIINAALAKQLKPAELGDLFRDMVATEVGGKVTDESDVKAGTNEGKEYRIEGTKSIARARVFVTGTRVLLLRVSGKKELVDGDGAKIFLESGHFTAGGTAAKTPRILGGGFDAEFKDLAPEGGLLVGFEIGTSKAFGRDMIRSAKPIYRVGDKESKGEQRGTDLTNVVTIKAKDGYAVGGMSVKSGLGFDGMSVTFMKVVDGKLDPKDSYESEFVGSDEKKTPVKVVGAGAPVLGIAGKFNDKDMTGMGLIFKGQEGFEPKKK